MSAENPTISPELEKVIEACANTCPERIFKSLEQFKNHLRHYFTAAMRLNDTRVLTCVYCGHEYPQGTPTAGAEILTEHIRVCEKHPLRKAEQDKSNLRKALMDMMGLDGIAGLQELDGMEAGLRSMRTQMPSTDFVNAINALDVLRQTIPKTTP